MNEGNDGTRYRSIYAHRRTNGILATIIGTNTTVNGTDIKSLGNLQGPFFLLFKRKMREVPDCFTARRIGFDCDRARRVTNESLSDFSVLPPVPSFKISQQNPDEYMRIELLKINSVQKRLVETIEFLGDYVWHPSMSHFQNRTLLSARGPEKLTFEIPHFHWVDFVNGSAQLSSPLTIDTMGHGFVGKEQVRLVRITDDRIHMSFTVPNTNMYARMQTAELVFNHERDLFELSQPVYMYRAGVSRGVVQKNWVPFLYNGSIFFVYNIYPLVVIRPDYEHLSISFSNVTFSNVSADDPEIELITVSEEACAEELEQPWEYGHMRGGSPAQLVRGEYMAFFHSKSSPLDTGSGFALMSYWIGVYTFSPSPPFRLTRISRYPILLDSWYDGAWFDRNNAYIIYPAGFVLEDIGNVTYVMMSFSLQDRRGYMGRIRLDELLDSTMSVNCSQSPAELESEIEADNLINFESNFSSNAASSKRRRRHRK